MFQYCFIEKERLLIVRSYGASESPSEDQNRRKLRSQEWFAKVDHILIDMKSLESSDTDGQGMVVQTLTLNMEYQLRSKPVRYAVFAPADSYGYSIARMFQNAASNSKGFEIEVFETCQEAIDWLALEGTPEDYRQALKVRAISG